MQKSKFDFLFGSTVYQIKISRYQVIFVIEDSITIDVYSKIIINSPNGVVIYKQGNFSDIKEILELLEKKIVSVSETGNRLEISFNEGFSMVLDSDNQGYESYIVTHGDETYVI